MIGRLVKGAWLQALREEADIPREELARLIDCSPGHIRNVETTKDPRRHQLSGPKVHRIRRAIGERLGREIHIDELTYVDPDRADSDPVAA